MKLPRYFMDRDRKTTDITDTADDAKPDKRGVVVSMWLVGRSHKGGERKSCAGTE
jgi:hypothetical protein